jgi:hypothetical protein
MAAAFGPKGRPPNAQKPGGGESSARSLAIGERCRPRSQAWYLGALDSNQRKMFLMSSALVSQARG